MLGHKAIATMAMLAIPESLVPPYEIDLDDETEIDRLHLVILSPFLPADE